MDTKDLQAWMLEQFNEVNRKLDAAIKGIEKKKPVPKPKAAEGTRDAIAYYCDMYRKRYNTDKNPTLLVKDRGLLGNLVKETGLPRTLQIIEAYFTMEDWSFLQKKHDVPTLFYNLNKVTLLADTGVIDSGVPKFNSLPKGPDWDEVASLFIQAVRQFPSGDEKTKAFLGHRWPLFLKVGRDAIAKLPDNQFGRRDLANMIKAAASAAGITT